MTDTDDERRWTIGELAKASGTTVRTLHHYDEIGLVRPTERTGAGHRRYTAADVRRLYRVRALARLGLSLDEVSAVLARSMAELRSLLAELEAQAVRIADVRGRVQALLDQLDEQTFSEPERFLSTLEPLHSLDIGAYLSPRQQDALRRRADELGADAIEDLKSKWLRLAAKLRERQQEGTPVDDADVRELVARWDAIGAAFRVGDAPVEAAAAKIWQDSGPAIGAELEQRVGWTGLTDVVAYVERVREHRDR